MIYAEIWDFVRGEQIGTSNFNTLPNKYDVIEIKDLGRFRVVERHFHLHPAQGGSAYHPPSSTRLIVSRV